MAINISASQKKVQTIQKALERCALLLSNNSFQVDGSSKTIKGLDLSASKSFAANAYELKEGKCKILVMGPLKSGKSTIINALIGEYLLPTRSKICTAVVTVIKGGENTGEVTVFFKDGKPPITISLEQFKEEYKITQDDNIKLSSGEFIIRFDSFSQVDHVEIVSANKLLKDGVQIIDTPGLEENYSRIIATKSFLPRADAVIFTLDATSLFLDKEVEYIRQQFYGTEATNIFFVVNRVNQLMSSEQLAYEIKPKVKWYLAPVFTDKNGKFNEELYNRRVFYINALGAYCARTNVPNTANVNGKNVVVPGTAEESGILEFEQSLNQFLNSDERLLATFQSTLASIAIEYKHSVDFTSVNQKNRQNMLDQLETNSEENAKAEKQREDYITEDMKNCFNKAFEALYGRKANTADLNQFHELGKS